MGLYETRVLLPIVTVLKIIIKENKIQCYQTVRIFHIIIGFNFIFIITIHGVA